MLNLDVINVAIDDLAIADVFFTWQEHQLLMVVRLFS
jgi:hypothetical protein